MQKGKTSSPCPGCGESGYRNKDKVCFNCQRKLQEAEQAREAQAKDTEYQVYDVPARFPYYAVPIRHPQQRQNMSRMSQAIAKEMAALVLSVARPFVGMISYGGRSQLFHFPKGNRVEYSVYDQHLLLKPETA